MTDWAKIESVLDDRSTGHTCAICGGAIPAGVPRARLDPPVRDLLRNHLGSAL